MTIPDDIADRLATEAAHRGMSAEEVAAEVLMLHVPTPKGRTLPFIAMFDAPEGFDVQHAEEMFEAEGFVASS